MTSRAYDPFHQIIPLMSPDACRPRCALAGRLRRSIQHDRELPRLGNKRLDQRRRRIPVWNDKTDGLSSGWLNDRDRTHAFRQGPDRGMTIAGIAAGATKGYVYIRSEYPHAIKTMESEQVAGSEPLWALKETLGDETEEIARRLQTIIYIDISLVHTAA
jgi:hypothetical protein